MQELVKCNNKKSVKIHWIKAHAGIKGNELADTGAKDAHQKSDITMCTGNFYQYFHAPVAPQEVLVGILDLGFRLN